MDPPYFRETNDRMCCIPRQWRHWNFVIVTYTFMQVRVAHIVILFCTLRKSFRYLGVLLFLPMHSIKMNIIIQLLNHYNSKATHNFWRGGNIRFCRVIVYSEQLWLSACCNWVQWYLYWKCWLQRCNLNNIVFYSSQLLCCTTYDHQPPQIAWPQRYVILRKLPIWTWEVGASHNREFQRCDWQYA